MTLDELIPVLLDIRGRIPYSGDMDVWLGSEHTADPLKHVQIWDDQVFLWDETGPA